MSAAHPHRMTKLIRHPGELRPVGGMPPSRADILVTRDILGAAHPHGATSLLNLYAAMPSLHVAWAAWCAIAIVIATGSRWRHLAWLYPAATIVVVLASANHFLLDAAGGLAIAGLGVLATSRPGQLLARHLIRPSGPASPRTVVSAPPPAMALRARATGNRRCLAQASRWLWAAITIGAYTVAGCPLGHAAPSWRLVSARVESL
jgi:PAP2 superfamily